VCKPLFHRQVHCLLPLLQSRMSPASTLHVSLDLASLDVSIVDGRPQELLLLTLDGLAVEYHAGNSAGIAYSQVRHRQMQQQSEKHQ
jgi:hypothetical protein